MQLSLADPQSSSDYGHQKLTPRRLTAVFDARKCPGDCVPNLTFQRFFRRSEIVGSFSVFRDVQI